MRYLRPIVFLFLLLSAVTEAQEVGDAIKTKRISYLADNKKLSALDTTVEKAVIDFMQSPQNCGLSIGIIKNDTAFFYNYGETSRDNKTLPDKNTIYEIGSVTKTFCGILLAYAVSEGKVKLSDDIRNYLPEKFPNLETNKHVIEIKQLANHTSGLPSQPDNIDAQQDYNPLNPFKNYTKKMLFDYLRTVRLGNEPGQVCEYSNTGVALLGVILEEIYHKPLDEIIKEKICVPNMMNTTGINLTDEQLKFLAAGYNANGKPTPHWDLGAFAGAGGIRSTAADMIRYLQYNINENDVSVKLAHRSTINKNSNIALGWHLVTTKFKNELVWHNGATFGFSSFCGFIREKHVAVVILSNTVTSVDHIALSILKFLQQ